MATEVDSNVTFYIGLAPDVSLRRLRLQDHPVAEDFRQGQGGLAGPWAEHGQDCQEGGSKLEGVHVVAAASDDERRLRRRSVISSTFALQRLLGSTS